MSMTSFGGDLTYSGRDLSVYYVNDPHNQFIRMTPANLARTHTPAAALPGRVVDVAVRKRRILAARRGRRRSPER